MFEGLIEFIEDALLSRLNLIQEDHKEDILECVKQMLMFILGFAETNPD